jgi:fructose-bisphosphate aldolase class II
MKDMLDRALADRYGVAAFNILNDLTIEAVLQAAVEEQSPVILQTSVKTVRAYGRERLFGIFSTLVKDVPVPVTLHLDHCPSREVISDCLVGAGTPSCSTRTSSTSPRTCGRRRRSCGGGGSGRARGGRDRGHPGRRGRHRLRRASAQQSLEVAVDFISRTGVHCFAPAIGNAHGQYTSTPVLDHQRVTDLVEATGVPMALHGGTGLSADQFRDLIARGCAKVNISTALKESYMKAGLEHLKQAEAKDKWDPPTLFTAQKEAVMARRASICACSAARDGPGERRVTALVFDCDGVLADTERYGHLPAFNATFEEHGLPVRWSEDDYAELLRIGGGKERMATLFRDAELVRSAGLPRTSRASGAARAVAQEQDGPLQGPGAGREDPRPPGIARVIGAALDAGWTVAVASTSAEESVKAVLAHAVGSRPPSASRSSPATSSRPRSRTRPSTSSPSAPWTWTGRTPSSSRTRATACWRHRRRPGVPGHRERLHRGRAVRRVGARRL